MAAGAAALISFRRGTEVSLRSEISRRSVSAGCIAVLLGACTAQREARIDLLVVCQAGSVKSAIARELARRRAVEKGLALNIQSRGIAPANHISAALQAHLRADAIDPLRDPLTRLDSATLQSAKVVVAFDALPTGMARPGVRDWSEMPSMNEAYDQARAFLDPRLDALLNEIAARSRRA